MLASLSYMTLLKKVVVNLGLRASCPRWLRDEARAEAGLETFMELVYLDVLDLKYSGYKVDVQFDDVGCLDGHVLAWLTCLEEEVKVSA